MVDESAVADAQRILCAPFVEIETCELGKERRARLLLEPFF
jgi:hypothetical protein